VTIIFGFEISTVTLNYFYVNLAFYIWHQKSSIGIWRLIQNFTTVS